VVAKMSELHGYYSAEQALAWGCVIYTLMATGEEVQVTAVYYTPTESTKYPDMRYVGQLKEYVRRLHEGKNKLVIATEEVPPWRVGRHSLIKHSKK
jgi:hypothetical protein